MGRSFEYRGLYAVPDSSTSIHLVSPDNPERRLLAEYETATRFYSWAVNELSNHQDVDRGSSDWSRLADSAKEACEAARVAIEDLRNIKIPR